MPAKYSMSAVVPAYNEERRLEAAVLRTMITMQALGLDYEVIIVDDGSTDLTSQIAGCVAAEYPQVQFVAHASNQGLGGAFKTGLSQASKEYVILVPVDSPLDVPDLQAYLPRLAVCDIVVGVRSERLGYTLVGRFMSFVYNRILVPLLFNLGLADVNWIQVYRRELFTKEIVSFHNRRMFYLVEILVQARRNGLIVAEVPSAMKKRLHGRASNTRPSVIIRTLWDMFSFFWRQRNEKYLS